MQRSVDLKVIKEAELLVKGRHDPCVALRAVPVVESIASMSITDLMIRAQMISRIVGE